MANNKRIVKDNPNIIRSSADDVRWLFSLFATVRTTQIANDTLGNRLDIIGKRERLREIHDELLKIVQDVFQTFPPEKHATINRQLDTIHYKLEIGRTPYNDDGYVYTKMDDLDVLIKFAHKMNCQICSHPSWCNSRCKLGKALDRCCPESRGRKESWSNIDVTADV